MAVRHADNAPRREVGPWRFDPLAMGNPAIGTEHLDATQGNVSRDDGITR